MRKIKPTGVLLIPAYGHSDDNGFFTTGPSLPNLWGSTMVDEYLTALHEELEAANVRSFIMKTRSRPGIKESDRVNKIDIGQLTIDCAIGWSKAKKSPSQHTTVYYGTSQSKRFADIMFECLEEWSKIIMGNKYVQGKVKRVRDPLLGREDIISVRIEPFNLNASNIEDFWKFREKIGRSLGSYVADYLHEINKGAFRTIYSNRGRIKAPDKAQVLNSGVVNV